jgi:hypothetical protein
VDRGKVGYGDVYFEAFDGDGCSLGKVGPVRLGDGRSEGFTEEDRFFGAFYPGGISAITISMPECGDWEVDHFQYGRQHDSPAQARGLDKRPVTLFDDVVYAVRRNWTPEFEQTFQALEPVATIRLLASVRGKPFSDIPAEHLNIQTIPGSAIIDKLPGGASSYQICIDIPVRKGTRALLRFKYAGLGTPVPYFGVRDDHGRGDPVILFPSSPPDTVHEILFMREDNWVAARLDDRMIKVSRVNKLSEPVRMYFHMNDISHIALEEVRVGHSGTQLVDVYLSAGRG